MTEGYSKLALLQGTYPQLGIYRRFATLNARNLLYYQAELVDLEERLDKQTIEDINATEEKRKHHSRDWYSLSKTADGVPTPQWEIMLKIREKLLQYSKETLGISYSALLKFISRCLLNPATAARGLRCSRGRESTVPPSMADR
jgi:hypothetical protein